MARNFAIALTSDLKPCRLKGADIAAGDKLTRLTFPSGAGSYSVPVKLTTVTVVKVLKTQLVVELYPGHEVRIRIDEYGDVTSREIGQKDWNDRFTFATLDDVSVSNAITRNEQIRVQRAARDAMSSVDLTDAESLEATITALQAQLANVKKES